MNHLLLVQDRTWIGDLSGNGIPLEVTWFPSSAAFPHELHVCTDLILLSYDHVWSSSRRTATQTQSELRALSPVNSQGFFWIPNFHQFWYSKYVYSYMFLINLEDLCCSAMAWQSSYPHGFSASALLAVPWRNPSETSAKKSTHLLCHCGSSLMYPQPSWGTFPSIHVRMNFTQVWLRQMSLRCSHAQYRVWSG